MIHMCILTKYSFFHVSKHQDQDSKWADSLILEVFAMDIVTNRFIQAVSATDTATNRTTSQHEEWADIIAQVNSFRYPVTTFFLLDIINNSPEADFRLQFRFRTIMEMIGAVMSLQRTTILRIPFFVHHWESLHTVIVRVIIKKGNQKQKT